MAIIPLLPPDQVRRVVSSALGSSVAGISGAFRTAAMVASIIATAFGAPPLVAYTSPVQTVSDRPASRPGPHRTRRQFAESREDVQFGGSAERESAADEIEDQDPVEDGLHDEKVFPSGESVVSGV